MSIRHLVEKYKAQRDNCLKASYNETQLRNDFIDPFLKCLGWDVDNEKGKSHILRDVIQEEFIQIQEEQTKKTPDYTLRINGTRKLFVEAKKPYVDILKSPRAAFQTRRYGWNGNLGISVLTNFENLVVYDCRFKPDVSESEVVARIKVFNFDEYVDKFEEIYQLLSFDAANSGLLDEMFSVYQIKGQTFDHYFLNQIVNWRRSLAESAIHRNGYLNSDDLNFLIQRLLNRIIFLRICEDRNIENYETLKNVTDYTQLRELFKLSDKKFNSGLFDFIDDTLSLKVDIDAEVLIGIFNELYYPLSPYDFSVVDPAILSQIYERFLASRIHLDNEGQLSIYEEPEVMASNGVVPTPKLIVEQIVDDTLTPLVTGKPFHELQLLKVADICCGSGSFLISAFEYLQEKYLQALVGEGMNDKEWLHHTGDHTFALTLKAKRTILEQNLFGVDINPYACEVTEFSLLLKLLEGENQVTIDDFLDQYSGKVLPNLKDNIKYGNSLVDTGFFEFLPEVLENDDLLCRVNPFDWIAEYPFFKKTKGFDAIIGNPPYVRIQNLVKHIPDEIRYYQSELSGYSVAKKETIDKYYIFIQRAIQLLNDDGYLGYIIPHKFFIVKGGASLREYITDNCSIVKINHFGVNQVFPERSTYTAILVLKKQRAGSFLFRRLKRVSPETLTGKNDYTAYSSDDFGKDPWIFLSPQTRAVFDKIHKANSVALGSLAEICVGLQTSADKIYIFYPEDETIDTYRFIKNKKVYEIEKAICLPAIYDLSFDLYDPVLANARIIFPYTIEDNKAEILDEDYFRHNFPLAWDYLYEHKDTLERRNLQGNNQKWYQFGRSQSLTRFHQREKLIWSVLATSAPYTLDSNNLQFTGGGNGPYYALTNRSDYSLLYFLGILSHPIFEAMVKAGASEFRGAYYSHGKQFIENLPIRLIQSDPDKAQYNTIVQTVSNLINTKKNFRNSSYGSNRTILERKMDTLNLRLIKAVNTLYHITDDEYHTVVNDEMFKTDLAVEE